MNAEDRIRLRAPERSDLPAFVRWMNDPEVTAGLMTHLPLSLADEEIWFESMLKRPQAEHPLTIEVLQDGSWTMIGNSGFHEIDWRVRAAEVGIVIGEKQFWNQGYGTQAMRLLLRVGFGTLNLNRICLQVYANNRRAIRSYEKAGFIEEGRKRQGMYKNGEYIDIVLMSVLRSEWEAAGGTRA